MSNGKTYSQLTIWLLGVRDQRDRIAFAALFDHLAPRLKGFVMRSGASAALAEEIVQDVMLTIWRKAAQFDPHKAQASAWIYQIARNRHIDIVRKESRPVPDELGEDPGTEPDASQILGLEQETEQLKRAISQLQPDQKEMIEKAYIGELTHQEISPADRPASGHGQIAHPPWTGAIAQRVKGVALTCLQSLIISPTK